MKQPLQNLFSLDFVALSIQLSLLTMMKKSSLIIVAGIWWMVLLLNVRV